MLNMAEQLINQYFIYVILGQSLLTLIFLIMILALSKRVRNLRRAMSALVKNKPQHKTNTKIDDKQWEILDDRFSHALQRVGIIRYSAFNDVGGDLSFSLALLDGHGDGLVLSSLHGRDEARSFVKPIKSGGSHYQLSPEETQAVEKALKGIS
ncbi:MAG: DUF4446 family protein [Clostridia bacterium]|nr:DUF4446 family protein [Clostridia bacterium]